MLFLPDDSNNYKRWAIKARIKTLEKLIRLFPDSPVKVDREIELRDLQKELES